MTGAEQIMEAIDRLIRAREAAHEVEQHDVRLIDGSGRPSCELAGEEVIQARLALVKILKDHDVIRG